MSWLSKTLSEIFDLSGRHRAGDQDLPVLSITMRHGLVDQADKFKKRVASLDTSKYRIAYKNELVVGFPIDEGVLGFQTKYPAGIVSPAYDIWKLKNKAECHIPYLERYLRSPQARSLYASRMQGAVARRRSLTKADFLNLEIPFPPLDDQIRIAQLLGKVEGLIAQRKQNLQQLDDLLRSVFLEIFGDPALNEKGWNTDNFEGIVLSARNGLSPSRAGDTKGLVYTLTAITGNSFKEVFKEDKFTRVRDVHFPSVNDFLVCRGNGNRKLVGKGHFYPGAKKDVMFPDTMIGVTIKLDSIKKAFLEHLWKTDFIRYQIEKVARTANGTYKINQKTLGSIKIIIPRIDLQNDFSAVVEKVERLKIGYLQSLTDLENLYGALSQQAFKGELVLSRLPLPSIQPEEEKAVAAETLHTQTDQDFAINLPDTDHLPDALENAEAREALISQWLEAYRGQLGGTPFSVQHFMAAAQTRLEELHPDNDFELRATEYEHIKAWVFKALAAGTLVQAFDDEGNSIQLKAVQA